MYSLSITSNTLRVSMSNTGAPGATGTSAYQAAVAGGYVGTESQFNSYLADIQANVTASVNAASSSAASATIATTKASEASTSATNASTSATSAATSASTATTKASEASTSANNAATSASNASSSATSAANSASSIAGSVSAAATSATNAATSASSASTSASNASLSAANAATSETNASLWATKLGSPVSGGEYSAKYWAQQAAASITGQMIYRGVWDASSGSYPAAPTLGSFYKVSVSGLVSGTQYDANDSIVYNGTTWDKIDNTEAAGAALNYQDFNTGAVVSSAVGRLTWNSGDQTLDLGLSANCVLQVGQETLVRVYNNTGSLITNGSPVYITGSQGNRVTVALANSSSEATSSKTIGIATEDIANATEGFVTHQGIVRSLNTSAYTEGTALWVGSTAGTITSTRPTAPGHAVLLGWVTRQHATVGTLFVNVANGYELEELHNVKITSVADKHVLIYDNAQGVWVNRLLLATDIPTLNQNTTGTAANVTGTVAIANGGTGATSAAAAKTNLSLNNVDNTSDANKPVSTAQQAALDLKASIASPTFTGTVGGITKAMVGLGSVDNTADTAKPISTATQSALDLKAPLASPTFTGTVSGVTKAMVDLGSVDNTADTAKPISTAQQAALDLKAPLASPTFTGTVNGITATMVGLGNVNNTSDANKPVSTAQQTALNLKADAASSVLTGTTTATVVKFSSQYAAGNSGTAVTVNFANGQKQALTLTGNATVTLSFPGVSNYLLVLTQDATGSRTVTWSGVTRYVGSATAPAINTAASSSTIMSFYYDGTNVWMAGSKVNA